MKYNKHQKSTWHKKLNLSKYLFLGASHKKLDRSADKISSDCLEAVIGAVYIDGGLKSVEKLILNFLILNM